MRLTTIADLDRPAAERTALIERAMLLGQWYEDFKAQDTSAAKYEVHIGGDKQRAPGIHASEISNCQRVITYSVANVERKPAPPDPRVTNMRMRFGIGHAVHAMIQNDMHRMCALTNGALTFEDEVRITPQLGGVAEKWGMHSSCDGVFTFWSNGEAYLRVGLEIKTMSDKEFGKLVRPKPEHSEQTCFYMAALDVPLMWTLYYNKSDSNFTKAAAPHLFSFDKNLWAKLEQRFAAATAHAQAGTLPERSEGFHCSWCPFAWTCGPAAAQRSAPRQSKANLGALRVR